MQMLLHELSVLSEASGARASGRSIRVLPVIPVLSPALQLRKQNRFFSCLAGKILGPVRTQLLHDAAGGSLR
jgi:hypothetical protein